MVSDRKRREDISGQENSMYNSKRVRWNQEQDGKLDLQSQGPGEAEEKLNLDWGMVEKNKRENTEYQGVGEKKRTGIRWL